MLAEQKHKIFRTFFVTLIFALFSLMFWPFFTSLLLAALFAFALQDIVSKLESKKINRKMASLILLSGLLLFIALPLVVVILKLAAKINEYSAIGFKNTELYSWTLQIVHQLTDYIINTAQSFNFDLSSLPKPIDLLNDYSGSIGSIATSFLTSLPRIALNLVVFICALFYFLYESSKIKKLFINFDVLSEVEINQIIDVIKKSSFLTLVASVSIAFLQASIISIFAYFCGFTDFFMIFIITFIFALIPIVGSAPPALFLILVSLLQGNMGAVVALAIAFVIATSADNVIKAVALNTANDQIHPIISLLALIGAILIYGATGILLGPILTQLAFNIVPIVNYRENTEEIQKVSDF